MSTGYAGTCIRPSCTRPAGTYTRGYCESDYRRMIRMGRFGTVDATCARQHLGVLRDAGWTWWGLHEATGLAASTLREVGIGETRRVDRGTERTILALPVTAARSHRGTDATGTRRRVAALGWMGWPRHEVARRVGVAPWTLTTQAWRGRVSHNLAARVAAVFDELWDRPGPSAVAAGKARSAGAAPPLAWDDIDDPTAQPNLGPSSPNMRRVDHAEVAWLRSFGTSDELIARQLGVRVGTVRTSGRRAS